VVSAERLRYSESLAQSLPYYSTWVLVVLSLLSFIFVLMGGFIIYSTFAVGDSDKKLAKSAK
jgi:hypothetical protein